MAALTGILPEEALGAAKVLPDQRRVPLEIIHEDFVQSLGPVDAVDDVGVCGGRSRENEILTVVMVPLAVAGLAVDLCPLLTPTSRRHNGCE